MDQVDRACGGLTRIGLGLSESIRVRYRPASPGMGETVCERPDRVRVDRDSDCDSDCDSDRDSIPLPPLPLVAILRMPESSIAAATVPCC